MAGRESAECELIKAWNTGIPSAGLRRAQKRLTDRQYQEVFGITDRTALRDLKGLVAAGQAQRVGGGRNVRYIAT